MKNKKNNRLSKKFKNPIEKSDKETKIDIPNTCMTAYFTGMIQTLE